MKKIAAILCILFLAACTNNGPVKLKAYIFERRELPGNKLLLSYFYKKDAKLIQDSCIIDNKVIAQDSIPVDFLAQNAITDNYTRNDAQIK